MSLKQSTRASHIHTQWIFLVFFFVFCFFLSSLIIQIVHLRCKFWRFSHTKRTEFEQGASGLACTPCVQGPLTCLHVYLWASCGAPACFGFTCLTECVLNGIYTSRSRAPPPARSLRWYLHRNKDGGRGVWGRGGGERFRVGSKGHRCGGGSRRGGVWVMHLKFDSSWVNDDDPWCVCVFFPSFFRGRWIFPFMALPGHHLWVRFKVSLWSLTTVGAAQRGPLPFTVDPPSADSWIQLLLNAAQSRKKKNPSRTQHHDVNLCKYSLIAETSEHASVETTSHGYINLRKTHQNACSF